MVAVVLRVMPAHVRAVVPVTALLAVGVYANASVLVAEAAVPVAALTVPLDTALAHAVFAKIGPLSVAVTVFWMSTVSDDGYAYDTVVGNLYAGRLHVTRARVRAMMSVADAAAVGPAYVVPSVRAPPTPKAPAPASANVKPDPVTASIAVATG
jgi:hypothetical protein